MADGVLTKNEEVDAANEAVKGFTNEPHIVQAAYHPEPGLELLILTLSDGSRLLIPREDLSELKNATRAKKDKIEKSWGDEIEQLKRNNCCELFGKSICCCDQREMNAHQVSAVRGSFE